MTIRVVAIYGGEVAVQVAESSVSAFYDERSGSPYFDRNDAGSRLGRTTDARIWAAEWCRIARELVDESIACPDTVLIDEDWMTTWFANAIETGRVHSDRA